MQQLKQHQFYVNALYIVHGYRNEFYVTFFSVYFAYATIETILAHLKLI